VCVLGKSLALACVCVFLSCGFWWRTTPINDEGLVCTYCLFPRGRARALACLCLPFGSSLMKEIESTHLERDRDKGQED